MSSPQRVIRQRRQYNQWVGNQTLVDFALRFTVQRARRSAFMVGNTALGAVSFLACEAIGGSITLAFGFANAMGRHRRRRHPQRGGRRPAHGV
jgi:hypothetical protein